jgi:hypothetical protein
MKTVAYCALHYGKPYLSYAIRSVIDAISEFHVLYSDKPSHGYTSIYTCPDTEDELHQIAWDAAGTKLRWHKDTWQQENQQRNSISNYAPDADVVLVVDSDEAYADGLADEAIAYGIGAGCNQLRLPFTHMWRSFKRGFAHDPAYPTRIVFPKQRGQTITMPTTKRVWHYGYAQPSDIVWYKTSGIHGHQAEFRHDVNWFQDIFMANRQYDCHPIGSEYWNCEDIDLTNLPSVLQDHPYKDLDLIP